MDGIHDLGGKQGFGPVIGAAPPRSQTVGFEERWHACVHAIVNTLMVSGITHNVDRFRHAIERIDPACYLTDTYYGRWLGAAETLLVEAGTLTQVELNARVAEHLGTYCEREGVTEETLELSTAPIAAQPDAKVQFDYQAKFYAERASDDPARFAVEQLVTTRKVPSAGHTRLPSYVRGKTGNVIKAHGVWVLPDTNAHGLGECPTHLYTVEFGARELWGDGAEDNGSVCIDLFEPYLEHAG